MPLNPSKTFVHKRVRSYGQQDLMIIHKLNLFRLACLPEVFIKRNLRA